MNLKIELQDISAAEAASTCEAMAHVLRGRTIGSAEVSPGAESVAMGTESTPPPETATKAATESAAEPEPSTEPATAPIEPEVVTEPDDLDKARAAAVEAKTFKAAFGAFWKAGVTDPDTLVKELEALRSASAVLNKTADIKSRVARGVAVYGGKS